jgi:hypothetical protein
VFAEDLGQSYSDHGQTMKEIQTESPGFDLREQIAGSKRQSLSRRRLPRFQIE